MTRDEMLSAITQSKLPPMARTLAIVSVNTASAEEIETLSREIDAIVAAGKAGTRPDVRGALHRLNVPAQYHEAIAQHVERLFASVER